MAAARDVGGHLLVWHGHHEAFRGILVRLNLVVRAMNARAARQQQQKLRWRVRVVGGLRDIDVDVVELGDLL